MRGAWRQAAHCAVIVVVAITVAGCGSSGSSKRGGGYYKDDGPDANPPSNLDAIPDAVPRIEPYAPGNMKPYAVFGKRYVPDTTGQPYKMRGRASWYGKKFHGNSTANGERYDMYAMTAAHTTLPIPSYVRVTSMVNGRTVVLRVNDRGPFHSDRIIDLSYVAAHKLGLIGPGSGEVVIEKITHDDIRRGVGPANAPAPDIDAYPIAQASSASQIEDVVRPLPTVISAPPPAADPPASSPMPLPQATSGAPGSGVFLQLGAFSQPANAQALAGRVQQQVSAQQVHTSADPGGGLYRVKVGPYPSRDAAVQAAQDIYHRVGIMPAIAAQ
ncbi:MAG: septal ring lytic transglycosylase RlpA family protein [Burkholderiaceae bacterium]